MEELVALECEQRSLAVLLGMIGGDDWDCGSAAEGWTLRDQVAHLADTEEVAADTVTDGPRAFAETVPRYATAEEFTAAGCRRGKDLSPTALVDWWVRASARTRSLLGARAPDDRVNWGFGMSTRTFAAARLMEHWAHGLDIRDALGLPAMEVPRLRHVAALGLSTLRYAFARARVPWPEGRTLRLELTGAGGGTYEIGSEDATDVVRGTLQQWCRVATRRPQPGTAERLEARGKLAELAVQHARAYL